MAVTEQCDHIVGFLADQFPQFGGIDRLIRFSEGTCADEPFKFCPLCGGELILSSQAPLVQIASREPLQLIG